MATNSLVVSFVGPNVTQRGWFDIVQDREDDPDFYPALYRFTTLLAQESSTPGLYTKQRTRLRVGRTPIRIYHKAGITPDIFPLDAISGPDVTTQTYGFGVISLNTIGYEGTQIVYKGRKTGRQIEVLQFDNSQEESAKYAYDNVPITVRYTSQFLNAELETVSPPTHAGEGRFVTSEPVYGAMEIEYFPKYSYYWIYYDIPESYETIEVFAISDSPYNADNGQLTDKNQQIPPLQVIARSGQLIASADLRREVTDLKISVSVNRGEEEVDLDLEEVNRTTVTERITDPNDPNVYVDVNRIKSIEMYDPNARRTFKMTFSDP